MKKVICGLNMAFPKCRSQFMGLNSAPAQTDGKSEAEKAQMLQKDGFAERRFDICQFFHLRSTIHKRIGKTLFLYIAPAFHRESAIGHCQGQRLAVIHVVRRGIEGKRPGIVSGSGRRGIWIVCENKWSTTFCAFDFGSDIVSIGFPQNSATRTFYSECAHFPSTLDFLMRCRITGTKQTKSSSLSDSRSKESNSVSYCFRTNFIVCLVLFPRNGVRHTKCRPFLLKL